MGARFHRRAGLSLLLALMLGCGGDDGGAGPSDVVASLDSGGSADAGADTSMDAGGPGDAGDVSPGGDAGDASGAGDAGPSGVEGMVMVPAGTFTMGCAPADTQCDPKGSEAPTHSVTLDGFYIDETEVTTAAYRACVTDGACSAPDTSNPALQCTWDVAGHDDHPVVCVDWAQATAYCAWAGKRLPTEAEWEYAARGTDGRIYPWGDDDATCDLTVIDDGNPGCGLDGTWPVGSKPAGASPFGALDMAGNVFEWTADWFGPYSAGAVTNPQGPPSGSFRVFRGGGWNFGGADARTSTRFRSFATQPLGNLGIRCVRPL